MEQREKLKDQAVTALPDGYFQQDFDPPLFELQGMPANFQVFLAVVAVNAVLNFLFQN